MDSERDLEDVEMKDFHNQEKRLKFTRSYRGLLEKMHEIHDETDRGSQNMTKIIDVMKEADTLIRDVKNPDIALLDAKVISLSSTVLKQGVQALDTNLISFKPEELCDNIMAVLMGNAQQNLSRRPNWEMLFPFAVKCLKRTPSYKYLYGTFEAGEVVLPQRKARKPHEKEVVGCKKQPEQLMVVERQFDEIQDTLNHIMKTINRAYRENDNNPISYFELVINPQDYGATIENIFHVSFLVKDNFIEMSLDEAGLPVVAPVHHESSEKQRREIQQKNQMIMSMNMQEWEDLKEVYGISEPMIKPRPGNDKL